MDIQTVLLIILAAMSALGIVVFQYYYRAKNSGNLGIILSFLRFLALFGLLLLLINPKFTKSIYGLQKSNLILLADNSSSIKPYESTVSKILESIAENKAITERFNLVKHHFGSSLNNSDSLTFSEKNTNISEAISSLNSVYSGVTTAIVLLSDGNQTLGTDYAFYAKNQKFPIYPVVIGDTVRYEDLRIDKVNINRYAFLKNKFPIEAYITYEGRGNLESTLSITVDGTTKYREKLTFAQSNNTKKMNTLLEANSVGPKSIQVSIAPLETEKNKVNNQKNVTIEVIDEKTNVAIITDMLHPDIGTLTKAIESNEQRSVIIKKPTVSIQELEEVDLFVLYQPNSYFAPVYKYIQEKKSNVFTITGEKVDMNFLNNVQNTFHINGTFPVMESFGVLNPSFSKFDVTQFSLEGYPPLQNGAGIVEIQNGETILQAKVMGALMDSPLLAVVDNVENKEALLFGENLWKWRVQSYRDNQDFKNFDDFIGKLILYLSSNKSKNRLNVDYKAIYEHSNEASVSVTYFDESFEFERNANISLKLKGSENQIYKEIPMPLKGSYYEADLSDLFPGSYEFTVTVKNENHSKSGKFTILDFDVEQQLLSSDYKKLELLAEDTNAELFYPSNIDSLIQSVTSDNRYRPIESSTKNVVSLIDFRIILMIIIAVLALEWFIRKFNGLI